VPIAEKKGQNTEFLVSIIARIVTVKGRKKAKKYISKRVVNAERKVNVLNIGVNSIAKNV